MQILKRKKNENDSQSTNNKIQRDRRRTNFKMYIHTKYLQSSKRCESECARAPSNRSDVVEQLNSLLSGDQQRGCQERRILFNDGHHTTPPQATYRKNTNRILFRDGENYTE